MDDREYHSHTYQSDDASQSLQELLDNGFQKYGLDWIAVSDHLRVSKRDDEGNPLAGGSIPFSMEWLNTRFPRFSSFRKQGNTRTRLSSQALSGTCLHMNMWNRYYIR